jgi:hypothetical protein
MNESRYAVDRIEVNGIETYVLRNEVTKAEARLATSLGNNCYSFGILVNDEWIDLKVRGSNSIPISKPNPRGKIHL